MKKEKCNDSEELAPLFFYDDLSAEEQSQFEAHLADCVDCQDALAELKALENEIPRRPLHEPADDELFQLRQSLSLKMRADSQPREKNGVRWNVFGFLKPAPAFQFGFAALLLAFGFLLGRESKTTVPTTLPETANTFSLEDFISANRQIQSGQTTVNPFLAGIERLSYDPKDGTVNIHYNTMNEISLQGKFEDPMIRQMLFQAMLEEENPAVRLHAVKAANDLVSHIASDPTVEATLLEVLREEQNQGIRLQTIRLIGKLPFTETIKNVLFTLFLNDQDFAVRMQAFDALETGDLDAAGYEALSMAAQNDPSPYFRSKLEERLRQIEGQNVQPNNKREIRRDQ